MAEAPQFQGFPHQTVEFLRNLAANNSRDWFNSHKEEFEHHLMDPAREFTVAMGARLQELSPGTIADPRIDKSIFRIYRDTRFSKDKSPYKTHLGVFFRNGDRAKMECPGFYFHLEPPTLMLGVGMHCFSKPTMEAYREAVVDPKDGKALRKALETIAQRGDYEFGVKHYKRTPRGYDPKHENADLLLNNGLTAMCSSEIPDELHAPEIIDYCYTRFKDMAPIHEWLMGMIGRID